MKKEDIEFRKNCQLYHNKVKILLKKGKVGEAQKVIDEITISMRAWEDNLKSARLRINMLKSLFAQTTIEKRAFERRQQDD